MRAQGIAILPSLTGLHPGSVVPAPAARRPRPTFWQRIVMWNTVAAERRRLLELGPHMLKDIGLTPEEAWREARRPFWDLEGRG